MGPRSRTGGRNRPGHRLRLLQSRPRRLPPLRPQGCHHPGSQLALLLQGVEPIAHGPQGGRAAKPSYKVPPPCGTYGTKETQRDHLAQSLPRPLRGRPLSLSPATRKTRDGHRAATLQLLLGTNQRPRQEQGLPPADQQLAAELPLRNQRSACSHCGQDNHLLQGRCTRCQEVKSLKAAPIQATHWRCGRCGEENRVVRPACHGCFQPRPGQAELLRITAPSACGHDLYHFNRDYPYHELYWPYFERNPRGAHYGKYIGGAPSAESSSNQQVRHRTA